MGPESLWLWHGPWREGCVLGRPPADCRLHPKGAHASHLHWPTHLDFLFEFLFVPLKLHLRETILVLIKHRQQAISYWHCSSLVFDGGRPWVPLRLWEYLTREIGSPTHFNKHT